MKPDFGLRVALAVLFAFSKSGERENYDRFWRNLMEPYPSATHDNMRNIWRSNEAHSCFEWIAHDVGAPADPEFRSQIAEALYGSPKHPKAPPQDTPSGH